MAINLRRIEMGLDAAPKTQAQKAATPAKLFSGPGINPQTGASTVKQDQQKLAQSAVQNLAAGKPLTAAQRNILTVNTNASTTTKTSTTAPQTTTTQKTTPATTTTTQTPRITTQPAPSTATPPITSQPAPGSTAPPPASSPPPITAAPVSATPITFSDISSDPPPTIEEDPPIKSAPIDTVVFVDEAFSAEFVADILFEQIGGQEILSIARGDTVNGQKVIYQPIKNLGILQETYNPTSLLRLQGTSDRFFSNFLIDLRTKIPKRGSGLNGANYFLDLTTGNGVIELVNVKSDEQVQVQIISNGIIEELGI